MAINIDQKSVPFILISKKKDEKGTSRVSVLDTADYSNGWKFPPNSINLSWKNTVESVQV